MTTAKYFAQIHKQDRYDNSLEKKVGKVEELVKKNVISSNFASALIAFLIRQEVGDTIKHSLEHILHTHNQNEKWLFVSHSRKRTHYI